MKISKMSNQSKQQSKNISSSRTLPDRNVQTKCNLCYLKLTNKKSLQRHMDLFHKTTNRTGPIIQLAPLPTELKPIDDIEEDSLYMLAYVACILRFL